MNKMAKGALATGVGVALLLGGGGTLAVWNQTANASAGTIASGDLKLAAGTGTWTSNMTQGTVNVSSYKMVPGEKLTYAQDLTVTLDGDRINANLTVNDAVAKAFNNEANITMEYSTNGTTWVPATSGTTAVPLNLGKGTHTVKARIIVDFANIQAGNAQASTKQTQALTNVAFKLEQVAPTPAP
ncbi:MAG: alternate-type signal peptide domain-containing protein [Arthrobacter sp.]